MNARHRKTLKAIFTDPVSGSIKWRDVEALLLALGAEMSEGSGSRVRFTIAGQTLFLHRPHPSPDTKRWAIRGIREFLTNAGIGSS
ncbi:MAG: type II toxin-antitoxin system HicA family toxin [Bauldia sp.]|nr:MAG: type II toxin-antitoxin system HicA family toxin [Bauldia sp.]MBE0691816.1 type II toxin-antitoxin system HicA family toxin [Aquamicrobium sp.]